MSGEEQQLLAILKSITGSGSFVNSGTSPFIPPGLRVAGVGDIGFPMLPQQIEELIGRARQAPFGQGSLTITDTAVRKTWEIDAELLTFLNEAWGNWLDQTLESVKKAGPTLCV